MKKGLFFALLLVSLSLLAGCGGPNASVKKAFILNTCIFDVQEDALPIMKSMETIQKEANGGKEVDEAYVMSLYVKADKNKNAKITKKEAQKAYNQYLVEIRAVIGALPFQVPTPKE